MTDREVFPRVPSTTSPPDRATITYSSTSKTTCVVFDVFALARRLESLTGWLLKRFITTARYYREVTLQARSQSIITADPLASAKRSISPTAERTILSQVVRSGDAAALAPAAAPGLRWRGRNLT